jgi:hypothetical protein
MKVGPLSLFNNHIASWHWPWSLTWRWVLSVHRRNRSVRLGPFFMRTHCGGGVLCGLNTPLADIVFQSQPNMRR